MSFDPYHRWLGIPPGEQPPNHYRLLGIAPLEDNPDVIESAADRQMGHLRNHQSGKHSALSQKLLNEVAAAKVCLLNPRKKAAYDSRLREQIEAAERPAAAEQAASLDPGLAQLFEKTTRAPTVGPKAGRRVKPTQLWASAGIVALGLVAVVVIVLIRVGGSSHETAQSDGKAPALQPDRQRPPKAPPLRKGPSGAAGQRPVRPPKDTGQTPAPPQRGPAPPPTVAPFDAAKAKEYQQSWAKHLNVPVVGSNSIGMKFVLIPPGEFQMGSTQEEVAALLEEGRQQNAGGWYVQRVPSEAPKHRVRINTPLYLGLCEVTQAEYERVMGNNPSQFQGDASRPVEMVSWSDAVEFCRRLSESAGEKSAGVLYRLPTEGEWEYACRAGTQTRYSFGDDARLGGQYTWWSGNAQARTQPVGRLKPNAWGLLDVHGNVWEWCADWYAADYYAKSSTDDPTGPDTGATRVLRGGSWDLRFPTEGRCSGDFFRCADRNNHAPDHRGNIEGFRVALAARPGAAGLQPVQPPQDTTTQTPVASQPPPAEKPKRLPVPEQAERDKALAQLNEAYDLSKERTPSEKRKLAADLLELAEKARERPAERYVLLDAAMRLAGEGGDAAKMLELADRVGGEFEIDLLALKAAALETFADGAKDSARIGALVDASEKLIAEALGQDKHDLARELADRAYAACQQTAGRGHRKRAFDRRNEVQALAAAWKEVQGALDKLKTDPSDPEANLTAGRYFCFQKGDWAKGLTHLARSSDAELKAITQDELQSPPADTDAMVKLADAWWALSQSRKAPDREALMLRAGTWYREARPNVTSTLLKTKLDKRLAEIARLNRPIPKPATRQLKAGYRELVGGLVLYMPFDQDTIVSRDGKTRVLDLSGAGNHGVGEDCTPSAEGRVGGCLVFGHKGVRIDTTLLNRQPEYTVVTWFRSDADTFCALRVFCSGGVIFKISLGSHVNVSAWNRQREGYWQGGNVAHGSVAKAAWGFLAVRRSGTGAIEGKLTVFLNDRSFHADLQMLDNPDGRHTMVGPDDTQTLDELMIFHRALSDEEVTTLYQMGLKGEGLRMVIPKPSAPGLRGRRQDGRPDAAVK